MRLLVTRPDPDAQRTAAALRACGHAAIVAPLLRIEPVADVALGAGPYAAILVTSANAAPAIGTHEGKAALLGLPVFAVGGHTARAMRAAGFPDVISAGGAAADLVQIVAGRVKPPAPLLYLAGEERTGDLGGELCGHGFAVRTVVVYRAVAAPLLPQAAADGLASGLDGVLHFSRRTAQTYLDAARAAGLFARALAPAQFCLSEQSAVPLRHAGAGDVRVAERPDESALLALIGPHPG